MGENKKCLSSISCHQKKEMLRKWRKTWQTDSFLFSLLLGKENWKHWERIASFILSILFTRELAIVTEIEKKMIQNIEELQNK